ncbi:TcfC E-set like domain-containing protein [Vibrio jasicida]|uniref:TcfC E-set like domain-containing protein n=1 Tax=Vibrio jasicida TaxID=766224 RepID=UPI0005F05CAC|nr:TcfC E-set like domain-containing protein [Vibrio jasicida]
MKIRNFLVIGITILSLPFCSMGRVSTHESSIPMGFEKAFEFTSTPFKMRNLDGSLSSPFNFDATFEVVKIQDSEINELVRFLNQNSVKKDYQNDILDKFKKGFQNLSGKCRGKLRDCVIKPELYEFIINYNDREIYFFASEEVLLFNNRKENVKYEDSVSYRNGLINSSDIYLSKHSGSSELISVNNKLVIGMPVGYFLSDINLTNESDPTIYETAYHLDVENYRFSIGKFKEFPSINTTDLLNSSSKFNQNSINLGSSSRLLSGGSNSDKFVKFFAPQGGSVKVYRADRLIYQNNLKMGENSISYTRLPSGRYEIRLEVFNPTGELVSSNLYQIFNTTRDSLSSGEWDYLFSVGSLDDNDTPDSAEFDGDYFSKLTLTYKPTDFVTAGMSTLWIENDSMLTLGGEIAFPQFGLSSDLVWDRFDSGGEYLKFGASVLDLNFSYENFKNELVKTKELSSYLYGKNDYSRWSVSGSYQLTGGHSFYAIYSNNKVSYIDEYSYYPTFSDNKSTSFESISLGYSLPTIGQSWLNINTDYDFVSKDLSTYLTWTLPLSTTVDAIASLDFDAGGLVRSSSMLRKRQLFSGVFDSSSAEVSNVYDRKSHHVYQEGSLSISDSNDKARYNMSLYASTQGKQSVTAGLSSTQVLDDSGFYLTSNKSSAYILVDIDEERSDEEVQSKGYFSLRNRNTRGFKSMIYGDELVPLSEYKQYVARFDSDSVDLYNSGESNLHLYAHPGTIGKITPKVSRVISFVTAFNDIRDKPVKNVSCQGDGCLNVVEIVDGVYRVAVLEGLNFRLNSNDFTCLLPYELSTINQMNFGRNYCLPTSDDAIEIVLDGGSMKVKFLGVYPRNKMIEEQIGRFQEIGYKMIIKKVGDFDAIFISQSPKYFDEMLTRYESSLLDMMDLAINNYNAEVLSYPITKVK